MRIGIPKPLQPWLEERIETSRRAARKSACPRCEADILKGPSHDDVSLTARVDVVPVNGLQEVVQRMRGRYSYDLIGDAVAGFRLALRDVQHMRKAPRWPVLLDHECEG